MAVLVDTASTCAAGGSRATPPPHPARAQRAHARQPRPASAASLPHLELMLSGAGVRQHLRARCTRVRAVSPRVDGCAACASMQSPIPPMAKMAMRRHRPPAWGPRGAAEQWGTLHLRAYICAARHLIRPQAGLRPRRSVSKQVHPHPHPPKHIPRPGTRTPGRRSPRQCTYATCWLSACGARSPPPPCTCRIIVRGTTRVSCGLHPGGAERSGERRGRTHARTHAHTHSQPEMQLMAAEPMCSYEAR